MDSPRWRGAGAHRVLVCAGAVALLVAALPLAGVAQEGPELYIDTVAGTGTSGYNGDGIPATTAELAQPAGVALDPTNGDLYIADTVNSRVRRVAADNRLITTVAGTGTAGYNGDGIPATSAQVNTPWGVAVDPADGAVYIVDTTNHRVRRIDPVTGLISTIAGTGVAGYNGDNIPATTAQLNAPFEMAVGPDGALYIVDRFNHRVRRIDPVTGLITTVAGTGTAGYNGDGIPAVTAQLNSPLGMAVGADGAVYVADSFNDRVRRIDPDSGLISTIAGTGTGGYNGDGIPATSARMARPEGVAVRPDGALYIADTFNYRIRRVDPGTGLISTIVGTGTNGYNGDGIPADTAHLAVPTSVALDTDGTLMIADHYNHRVRVVGPVPMPGDTHTTSGVPVTINAPDGTRFTGVDDPDPGSASLAGDGSSITYTPPPNFDGDVPIDYTIRTTARWAIATTGTLTVAVTRPPPPTIRRPRQDQTLHSHTPKFSGTAEPDSQVVVRDADGNRLCTATASDDGSWSCRATRALPDGTYQVTARSTDPFGNTATGNTRQFTIDAPDQNGNGGNGGGGNGNGGSGRDGDSGGGPRQRHAALARTGSSGIPAVGTALMLLAGGTSLLAATRRPWWKR